MMHWKTFLYGPELLGHQTQMMREHVNKVTVMIVGLIVVALLAIGLGFTLLVIVMAKPGIRRSYGPLEEGTTTTMKPTTSDPRRTKRPRGLVEDVGVSRHRDADSLCQAPRLVHCSSKLPLVRDKAWFYMPGATARGSCIEWLPDHLCSHPDDVVRGEAYRFESLQECAAHCEQWPPKKRCTQPVPLTAIYNCTDGGSVGGGTETSSPASSRGERWFYDPIGHACSNWRDVCVYKSYATMAACVKDCLPDA